MATIFLASLGTVAVHAQAAAHSSDLSSGDDVTSNLSAANTTPKLDLAVNAGVNYSSSSSSVDEPVDATAAENFLSPDATQPPPRRRYGAPRYNDSSHNSDGSNKYTFSVAGGYSQPLGNTYHYLNPNFAFQVGGGRNWNKKFATVIQFDYNKFGFNGRTLGNQAIVEDPDGYSGDGIQGSLDGNSHVWSFTVNPSYTFMQGDKWGAYVIGGGGFFHKTANFFVTEEETVLTIFGYEDIPADATVDKYTSNAVGVDGGFGLTYKFSRFAGERFFAEARYDVVFNSQRQGITINNYAPYVASGFYPSNNLYPANSNRTTYLPIVVGVRF
jgi:hypothetical protein